MNLATLWSVLLPLLLLKASKMFNALDTADWFSLKKIKNFQIFSQDSVGISRTVLILGLFVLDYFIGDAK